MKKYLFLFLLPLTLLGQTINDISGTINYYYVNRISDGSIINLPYRIADIKWQRNENALSLYSHLAMEYRMPSDNHFLESTSPQDFIFDLRELYLTWQLSNGEIRIGKQIFSWGSVDGNSPVDNLNAYDYYYIFESGADQKIGSFSTAADFYLESWKIGFSISPIHNTNRLPINDPQFPVDLPASPRATQVIEVKKPLELGSYITRSFNKGDVTLSYFDGYDRVFSLSGVNHFLNDKSSVLTRLDTVFSYRKTEMLGIGSVLFLGNLTLRGDFAHFTTKDPNVSIDDRSYYNDKTANVTGQTTHYTILDTSLHFLVNAKYYQANIQFEYELPWDFQISGQYIKYDTLSYSDIPTTPQLALPDLESDFKPSEYFFPGLGTNIAILTKSVLLLDVTKTFSDNRMEWRLKTMIDQVHSGKLIEMGFGYDISESLKSYLAVSKVFGDDSQDNKYTFNHMEDFSHIRLELKYYY